MNTKELAAEIAKVIARAVGEDGRIAASANVNRGVCAGTVTYTAKPEGTDDEFAVMCLVREAYRANGLEIDFSTREGTALFFRVFLDACKQVTSKNRRVNIVERLVYEPRLYEDGRGAWMCPVAKSAEFNRLPSEVDLAQSPSFLNRKKRAAKKKPFDHPEKVQRVKIAGRDTYVTCDKCGNTIMIEHTEDRAA